MNDYDNDAALAATPNGVGQAMAVGRAAQEVQGAIVMAKNFPRDTVNAYNRIIEECQRPSLAESATYRYPRGGANVTGPSIRLAEVMARNWGNMEYGVVEMEQREGESTMMAFAWDLESNTRATRIFTVKHVREVGKGLVDLKGPRDVYEMTANLGARRLRACIMQVIPGDMVEAAVKACQATLAGNNALPTEDRVRAMINKFSGLGVTRGMIEKKLGHDVKNVNAQELTELGEIFQAIKDGMAGREDYFIVQTATEKGQEIMNQLNDTPNKNAKAVKAKQKETAA